MYHISVSLSKTSNREYTEVTMKRNLRILALVIVVLVAAVTTVSVVIDRKFQAEYSKFRLVKTSVINNEILAVWNKIVNVYLVKTSSGWIAFDAGTDSGHLRREFKAIGLDPSEVRAVFLTHSDSDHVAGVKLFPKATFYMGANERPLATGEIRRAGPFKNSLDVTPEWLADGDSVAIDGRTVRVIETPGHTPGAVSYLLDGVYLFTGDAFALKDDKIEVFNKMFIMDEVKARESILRLTSRRGIKMILTAHYGITERVDEAFAEFASRQ